MLPKRNQLVTVLAATLLVLTLAGQWPGIQGNNAPQPAVKIDKTTILGDSIDVESGKTVSRFLGIRYAKPPTGARRFQPPTAADLPRGSLDATNYGPRCPQMPLPSSGIKSSFFTKDLGMSEDCLFLNIFQPQHSESLPVLVYIHGGGFNLGAPDLIEGEDLAAEAEVIVVTIAYRLGVLGFLSTGDSVAQGNYGLWDQRLALQWIQKNIRFFGGDEKRVTLAGGSAGASSASMLSLSPESREFFKNVIQMSGSARSPWSIVSSAEALQAAKRLGELVGCRSEKRNITTQALVSCLRKQSYEQLVTSGTNMYPNNLGLWLVSYTWVPVVDGDLVKDLDKASSFPGPLMIGVTSDEGSVLTSMNMPRAARYIPDIKKQVSKRSIYTRHLLTALMKQELPDLVPLPYPAVGRKYPRAYLEPPFNNALNRLECAYFDDQEGSNSKSVSEAEMNEAFGDQAFLVGTVRYLKQFSNFQRSYLYYFDHQTSRPGIPLVRHVDELSYLFGFNTSIARTYSSFQGYVRDVDRQLERDFRKLVSNFIKTGNPNQPELPDGWPEWKPYTPMGGYYLKVSSEPELRSHLKKDKMALWIEELPEILTTPGNTTLEKPCTISNGSGQFNARRISGVLVLGVAIVSLCVRLLLS